MKASPRWLSTRGPGRDGLAQLRRELFLHLSPVEVLSIGAIEANKLLLHGNVRCKHSQRQCRTVADSFSHHTRSHPARSKDQHSHTADRLSQWKHTFRRAVFS